MAERSEDDVSVKFGGDTSELGKAFSDVTSLIKNGAKDIAESINPAHVAAVALGSAFEDLGEKVLEMAREALQEAIHAYAELGEEIEHMQNRLGSSSQELSVLKAGLDSVGLSAGTFEAIARRLPQILEQHAEKFKAAGVAYSDADGNLLSVEQTVLNITKHLEEFTAGSARNQEGVKLMGRSYYMMADVVKLTSDRMAEAKEVATQFGEVMSEEDVKASVEFNRETNLLQTALHGFYVEVGRALTPVLTDLAVVVRELAGPVFDAFKVVVVAVAATIDALAIIVATLWSGFVVLAGTAVMLTKVLHALATFDAKAATAAWEEWKTGVKGVLDDLAAYANKKIADLSNLMKGPPAPEEEPKTKDPNRGKLSAGTIAIMEAEAARELALRKEKLREMEEVNEAQHKHDLETEQEFWRQKIQIVQAGIDAEVAKLQKDLAIAKKEADQSTDDPDKRKAAQAKQIALITQIMVLERQRVDAAVQGEREMQDAVDKRTAAMNLAVATRAKQAADYEVSVEQDKIQQLQQLRLIDGETAEQMQAESEERSFRITQEYLDKKLQAELLTSSNIAQTREDAQIALEKAYQEHQKRMSGIAQAAELQRAQYSLQAQKSVQDSFATMVFDLTDGVKKLSDVFKNFALSVIHAFMNVASQRLAEKILGPQTAMGHIVDGFVNVITNGLDEILGKTVANQAAQTVATVAGTAERTAAEKAASGFSLATSAMDVIKKIMNFASETFAGVFAFLSGIMGPAAAGPAAVAGGVVAGVASGVASSAGGDWMIPGDRMNMVHAKETILPADKSKKLDDMLEGRRARGAMPPINITAMDSQDVRRALQKGGALHKEILKLARNFATVPR